MLLKRPRSSVAEALAERSERCTSCRSSSSSSVVTVDCFRPPGLRPRGDARSRIKKYGWLIHDDDNALHPLLITYSTKAANMRPAAAVVCCGRTSIGGRTFQNRRRDSSFLPPRNGKRQFPSSCSPSPSTDGSSAVVAAATTDGAQSNTTTTTRRLLLGDVVRGGKEDAVIALSVGGVKFHTLRSTVNQNAVLAEHVARAEANDKLLVDGAVFVDRDPKHFPHVLAFLRDKTDIPYLDCPNDGSRNLIIKSIGIPRDGQSLRELYAEATFFDMPQMQRELKCLKFTGAVREAVGGKVRIADVFPMAARAGALVAGALGSIGIVVGTNGGKEKIEEEWRELKGDETRK